jgi:hypothetical protein
VRTAYKVSTQLAHVTQLRGTDCCCEEGGEERVGATVGSDISCLAMEALSFLREFELKSARGSVRQQVEQASMEEDGTPDEPAAAEGGETRGAARVAEEEAAIAAGDEGREERVEESEGIDRCLSTLCCCCSCFVSFEFSCLPEMGESTLESAAGREVKRAEVPAGTFTEVAAEDVAEEEAAVIRESAAGEEEFEEEGSSSLSSAAKGLMDASFTFGEEERGMSGAVAGGLGASSAVVSCSTVCCNSPRCSLHSLPEQVVERGRLRARGGTGKEETGTGEGDEAMDTESSGAEGALTAAAEREETEGEEDKEIDAAAGEGGAATIVGATVDEEETADEEAGAVAAAAEVCECAGRVGECFCVFARGLTDARTAAFRAAVGSEKRGESERVGADAARAPVEEKEEEEEAAEA